VHCDTLLTCAKFEVPIQVRINVTRCSPVPDLKLHRTLLAAGDRKWTRVQLQGQYSTDVLLVDWRHSGEFNCKVNTR